MKKQKDGEETDKENESSTYDVAQALVEHYFKAMHKTGTSMAFQK